MSFSGTVAFATNYPSDEARRLWAQGTYPASHLWGGRALESAGCEVTYIGVGRSEHGRGRFGRHLRLLLGNRHSQWVAARSHADVLLAGDPSTLASLALLRRLGQRRPVVAVVHPQVVRTSITSLVLRSYDVVVTISTQLRAQLIDELQLDPARVLCGPYGPDLDWPGYTSRPGSAVVSTGKTHRDEETLLAALGAHGGSGVVHTRAFEGTRRAGLVRHVGSASYEVVMGDLQEAGVVAIPLARVDGTFGVSELNDALALGKPVVMTRNPFIDVDIEAVGCGIWVDPNDVGSWVAALAALEDPAVRQGMGRRGRAFAERHWNAQRFGDVVLQAVETAVAR